MAGRYHRIEDGLQRAVCDMLTLGARREVVWFAIPNGGARSKIEAAILQGLGVKAGAPDILIVIPPAGRIAGLELKAPGKKRSAKQERMAEKIVAAGGFAAVADSVEDVLDLFYTWDVMEPDRVRVSA
jgi:hypothetical protein